MTLDRRDPASAIPQLEKRISRLEDAAGDYAPKGDYAEAIHRHEKEDVVGLNEALSNAATDEDIDEKLAKFAESYYVGDEVDEKLTNLRKEVDEKISAAVSAEHPIGSYYMSSDPADPSVLFGGTWEAVSIEPFEYCWKRVAEQEDT